MSFPPYGTAVPALTTWQLSFNGVTMGPGTTLEVQKLEGIDAPDVRTGDAGRARDHGMFVGLDLMGGRQITVTAQLGASADGTTSFQTGWQNLANATVPGGTGEIPLYVCLPGYGTVASLARVRKRSMPIDVQFAFGSLADVSLQFAASDPRWYTTPTQQLSVVPPGTLSGFSFPLTFPLAFGGGSYAGALSVTNAGNIETRPVLTVTGPCTNPSITNASIAGNPNLTFDVTMAAGDTLVIDTDLHTATYFVSGSTIGATRLYTLARGSTWFTLQPGVTTLQFLTSDPTGTGELTCTWASAYVL